MMGSSKYEFNTDQFEKDIQANKERYDNQKQSIKDEIVANLHRDGSRLDETFSIYIEVLLELKSEYNIK